MKNDDSFPHIYMDGSIVWRDHNGDAHRSDGPAIEYTDYFILTAWCWRGDYHRTDGSAIQYANGSAAWFLNGKMTKSKVRKNDN